MTLPTHRAFTRRRLIGSGIALGALGLAGCSNEGRGGGSMPEAGDVATALPNYIRYEGVQGDLLGEEFNIADGFLRYPENPIKAVAEPPGDGQPIRAMTQANTPIPPRLEVNRFWQQFNETVGSPVEISLTASVDYQDRFATVVAGNRLPDLFHVANIPQRAQMLASTSIDLSDVLGGDKIAAYPHLANIPTASWRAGIFNGRLYGIPVPRGAVSTSVMYSRADLLDELGLGGVPTSLEEFVQLCRDVTASAANRWALGTAPTLFMRQMFGVTNGWSLEGDTLVSANEHPAQEEALNATAQLWKEKLIHPEAFTGQNQDSKIRFANDSSPLVVDTFSGWQTYAQLMPSGQEIRILPVPMHDGSGPGQAHMGGPTHNITAINKSAEPRLETMLKYLDFLATPFGTQEYLFRKYGTEGQHYEMREGNPVLNDTGKSETALELRYQADCPFPIYIPEMDGGTQAQFDAQKAIIPTAMDNPVAGLYSDTEASKSAQLQKALDQAVEDIIQGRRTASAWTEEVAKWKAGGGDQIRDELHQALKDTE